MNIYLLMEDGESFCIRASTMSGAVDVCENAYLYEREGEKPDCDRDSERKYYHEQILQSCSLVGDLKN